MSFWRTFGFHTVSAVETILDRESYTLEELLDEDEILQEVKSQNKKLLDFLTKPATLLKLFEYITQEPPEDADPKRRFKYPFLACEILCSEIWAVTEAIYRDESLLDVLFAFLDQSPPINPLLASYTSRVAIVYLGRRPAETLGYIKKKENIISKFINHLASASIMELLLKIIGSEELTEGAGIIQWLCGTELVESLLSKFDPAQDEEMHENAGQALGDIIHISSHMPNSPLLAQLESDNFVGKLFDFILSGNNSAMFHGLSVIIELLHGHQREATDDSATLETLPSILSQSVAQLEKFDTFLKSSQQNDMLTTVGQIKPLGFYRLKVIEFYASLLRTRYRCIDQQFVKLGSLKTVLDLFFDYKWNNFLHSLVEQIIKTILLGQNDDLKYALITEASLLDRIVEANKLNTPDANGRPKARLGYMGFLTTISMDITQAAQTHPKIAEVIEGHAEWKNYVDNSLANIRHIEATHLGGYRPHSMIESSGEEEDEYSRGKFGNFDNDNEEDENYEGEDFNNNFNNHFSEDDKNQYMYGDQGSDDSDEDQEGDEAAEMWNQQQAADVGGSPSDEGNAYPREDTHHSEEVQDPSSQEP